MRMFNKVIPSVFRNVNRSGIRNYHPPADFKPASMNDMPVPQGSWQADYEAKQRKCNMQLIGGIGFLIITLAVAKTSGCFYLNATVPEYKKV